MLRIIYRSRVAPSLDRAELFRLIYHARVANEARGLTGVLLRSERRLLQVLEGETLTLTATFEKIRRDPRHTAVEVIDERAIEAPTFPRWPMRYFDDRDIVKAMKALSAEAGDALPRAVDEAVRSFFVDAFFACPPAVSPAPPPIAPPLSPRLC